MPSSLLGDGGTDTELAFAAILMLLEIGEGFREIFGIFSKLCCGSYDKKAFVSTLERFIEFDHGSAVLFNPKFVFFFVEAAEVFCPLLDVVRVHDD